MKLTIASLDKPLMVALRNRAQATGLDVSTEEATHTGKDSPDFGQPVFIVRLKGDVTGLLTGKFSRINPDHRCGRVTSRLWWAL